MPEAAVQHLLRVTKALVRKADLRYAVAIKMVRKAAKVTASERTILNAFHARGVKYRPFRSKPGLQQQDVKDRLASGRHHAAKRPPTWLSNPDAIIDNKKFPVHFNGGARGFAARSRARGAYRGANGGLSRGFAKPTTYLPTCSGAGGGKVVHICAGVAGGRAAMWHEAPSPWNAQAAAGMYSGPLLATLKAVHPASYAQGTAPQIRQS